MTSSHTSTAPTRHLAFAWRAALGALLAWAGPVASLQAGVVPAGAWPQFRGPGGNAIADAQAIPLEFGPERHLLWKTAVPSGHSSPCVWGDRVFLTGHVGTTLKMICLRRSDGKLLWERERKIAKLPRYLHVAAAPANSTPATDGERVFFLFDDHGLVATDFDGAVVWEKQFPPAASTLSYGASPVVDEGRVYLNRDGGLESALVCLDARTGALKWKADRPKTAVSFSTPYVWSDGKEKHVLMGGSGRLEAYDAGTGAPVWSVSGLPSLVCASPAGTDGMIYFGGWATAHVSGRGRIESFFDDGVVGPRELEDAKAFFERYDTNKDGRLSPEEFPESRARDAFNFLDTNRNGFVDFEEWARHYVETKSTSPSRNVLLAIAPGGRNDITETHVKWEVTKGLPYVSSPVVYRDRLYLLKAGGFLSCLDARTGKACYESARLDVTGEFYATPVAVGDYLILCAQRGTVLMIRAGDRLEVVARNELAEPICATPAVVDNTIYIRSDEHAWAFRAGGAGAGN